MSNKMLGNMMRQAKQMQAEMMRVQEEARKKTVEATAGGGMVTVKANGAGELVSVTIDREVVDPADVEMLQDLVLAAANEAIRRGQELVSGEMAKLTGGLNIPGLGGLGDLLGK